MASLNPDNSQNPSTYAPSPIDLNIPRCENDYISVEQNATAATQQTANDTYVQTGTGAGSTAQVLIRQAGKRLFVQNSLAPASGSNNEIKVTRGGVYKVVYSGTIANATGGAQQIDLGVGVNTAAPTERLARVEAADTVNTPFSGSVVLALSNGDVLRLYDSLVTGATPQPVTILSADITVSRLGHDGQ